MEQVPEGVARWAVGEGRSVIAEVTAALAAGEDTLAVGTRLRARLEPDRAAFATAAAETRLRAIDQGIPGAEQLVLTRESLEQASHPAAAAWRADRAAAALEGADDPVLQDRCAGTGGDAVALAAHAPVLAVERDPGRAVLAADRARVLGVPVEVRVGDALDRAIGCDGAIVHADPDRRDATGRRARTLRSHGPPVGDLMAATATAAGRLVTVAPGVAWDDPDLSTGAEVVFLQRDGQLLEAVLCTGAARRPGARATAVLLDAGLQRTRPVGEREVLPTGPVGACLLEPASALVRARLHDELGRELGAHRIATRLALLTCPEVPPASPWYRRERVEAVLPVRPGALREHLRGHNERRVELVLHGIRVDVRRWLREAGSPPTGPHDLRVHLVRADDGAVAVLTTTVADGQ